MIWQHYSQHFGFIIDMIFFHVFKDFLIFSVLLTLILKYGSSKNMHQCFYLYLNLTLSGTIVMHGRCSIMLWDCFLSAETDKTGPVLRERWMELNVELLLEINLLKSYDHFPQDNSSKNTTGVPKEWLTSKLCLWLKKLEDHSFCFFTFCCSITNILMRFSEACVHKRIDV